MNARRLMHQLAVAVVAACVATTSLLVVPEPARVAAVNNPFSETPIIRGKDWLGGKGVDVHSNGDADYWCPDDPPTGWTKGNCDSLIKVASSPTPVYVGVKWQCVELAQRLWVTRGWASGGFGASKAYLVWDWAQTALAKGTGVTTTANGSLRRGDLHPGDLIVWNRIPGAFPSGHVSVINTVGPADAKGNVDVTAMEQNWGYGNDQVGTATYHLGPDGLLTRGRYVSAGGVPYIHGVVHHPGGSVGGPPEPAAPKVDLVFAIDTTGSMQPYIDGVKDAASKIVKDVLAKSDARIAVVEYRDHYLCAADDFAARVDLNFSTVKKKILASINGLFTGDGCDTPESVYSGLLAAIGLDWRAGSKKAVILMGDAPPHDPEPTTGYTIDDVIAAAEAVDPANIYAVDIHAGGAPLFADLAARTNGAYEAVNTPDEAVKAIVHDTAEIARAPVAITGGPYYGVVGEPVELDGSRSFSPDGKITRWQWDLDGDGTFDVSAKQPVTLHTFQAPVKGTVVLRVTDNSKPRQTASVKVHLRVTAKPAGLAAPPPLPTPEPISFAKPVLPAPSVAATPVPTAPQDQPADVASVAAPDEPRSTALVMALASSIVLALTLIGLGAAATWIQRRRT
jgi:PKD domain/von Willebrand factor type A domain